MLIPVPATGRGAHVWAATVTALIMVLPLLTIVVLAAPAWLAWPVLSEQRQRMTIRLLHQLGDWVTTIANTVRRDTSSPGSFPCERPGAVDPAGSRDWR